LYASLIGFHPRRLKVPTGDELPRNGLRSMRCLLLLLQGAPDSGKPSFFGQKLFFPQKPAAKK